MTKVKGATVPAGLQELLIAVAATCNTLSHEVSQGALIGLLGSAGTGDVEGWWKQPAVPPRTGWRPPRQTWGRKECRQSA